MKAASFPRFLLPVMALALGAGLAQADPKAGADEKKKPIIGKKPMVKVKHANLYKNSHIVTYRGEHAIVPKRSILYLPESMKSRVVEKPTGRFVLWPFFKQRNQDWIWTYEVTLDQAKGKTPLPEGKLKQFEKLNRVVIAQFRGNPVSVLKPANKSEDGKLADTENSKSQR